MFTEQYLDNRVFRLVSNQTNTVLAYQNREKEEINN